MSVIVLDRDLLKKVLGDMMGWINSEMTDAEVALAFTEKIGVMNRIVNTYNSELRKFYRGEPK